MEIRNTVSADERTHAADSDGFHRLLVVTDRSDASRAAFALAREWTDVFGAQLSVFEISEAGRGSAGTGPGRTARPSTQSQGPLFAGGTTLGARNRRLAEGIVEAARDSGADAIVLGIDRRRMAQRHLGRSLRDQIARATDLPVLVAPSVVPAIDGDHEADGPVTATKTGRHLEAAGRHGRA